jgi:hypothetical protein
MGCRVDLPRVLSGFRKLPGGSNCTTRSGVSLLALSPTALSFAFASLDDHRLHLRVFWSAFRSYLSPFARSGIEFVFAGKLLLSVTGHVLDPETTRWCRYNDAIPADLGARIPPGRRGKQAC